MRNKKGFTLVELVIVIAVIAILAGVMIGTFASVVKKAQKSAEQQEMAAARTEQVANDVLEKLNNQNWLGWEDFEEKLAKALADINVTGQGELTEASIKAAVSAALNEYAAAHPSTDNANTGLTEQQVKYIIENALSGQLTATQVKSIVNSAVANVSTLSKSQVQAIVDAAVGKTVTASQVKEAVDAVVKANKVGTSTLTVEDVEKTVNNVLNTKSYSTLTEKEVEKVVSELLKNYSISAVEVGSDESLADAIKNATTTTVAVKLTDDITTSAITVDKNTVIDLNGHTISLGSSSISVASGSTLTMKGEAGAVKSNATAISVEGNGQVVVDGGKFINNAGSTVPFIQNGDNGFLTINGGDFTVTSGTYYNVYAKSNSTTVINGGTFTGICVSTNASKTGGTENATCIINGGTFTQDLYADEPVIYWNKGTLSVYGGTFTSNSTVAAICGGKVNLYGGTFTSTGNQTQMAESGSFAKDGDVICVITARAGGTSYALESVFISKNIVVNPVAGAKAVSVYSGGSAGNEFGTATKTYETITEDITITK